MHLLKVHCRAIVYDVQPEAEKLYTAWQFRQVLGAVKARGFSEHVLILLNAAAETFDVCRFNRTCLDDVLVESKFEHVERRAWIEARAA